MADEITIKNENNNQTPLRGQVKWFSNAKGFGFITHQSGKDVFVHYTAIEGRGFKTLAEGEIVEYELKERDKGLQAVRVRRIEPRRKERSLKIETVRDYRKDIRGRGSLEEGFMPLPGMQSAESSLESLKTQN